MGPYGTVECRVQEEYHPYRSMAPLSEKASAVTDEKSLSIYEEEA